MENLRSPMQVSYGYVIVLAIHSPSLASQHFYLWDLPRRYCAADGK